MGVNSGTSRGRPGRWLVALAVSLASSLVGCGPGHRPVQYQPYTEDLPRVEAKKQRDLVVRQLEQSGSDNDKLQSRLNDQFAGWKPPLDWPAKSTQSRPISERAFAGDDFKPVVLPPPSVNEAMRLVALLQKGGEQVRASACYAKGCVYDLDASQARLLGFLLHEPNGPLFGWGAWRYLSGEYENDKKQKMVTLVVLDRQASAHERGGK